MDEVIYLEQDEEIPSVIDKLKNLEGKSVALVVPKGAAVLQSVVNLKILKLEAENLEKEIALVTQDKIGRNLASQVGLSVYDNIQSSRPIIQSPRPEPDINETIELDMSQNKEKTPAGVQVHHYSEENSSANSRVEEIKSNFFAYRKPSAEVRQSDEQINNQPPAPTPNIPSNRITAKPLNTEGYQIASSASKPVIAKKRRLRKPAIITLIVLLIASFYYFYPKATVTLTVGGESFEKNLNLTVDNNINRLDADRSAFPGELQAVENEVKQSFNATGTKEVGEKATGTITVYNGFDSNPHSFASGTIFTAGDKTFLADSAFTVPGATVSGGKLVSGKFDVSVTAQNSGDSFNIAASDFSIAGAPEQISGKSSQAFSGGSSRKLTIVSQDDLNSAKSTLTQQASEKNLSDLKKKADQQMVIDSAVTTEVLSYSATKNSGDEASTFDATIKLKSRTLSFLEKDYREMLVEVLNKNLPVDKELILSTSDEVTTLANVPDYSTGLMILNSNVKTKISNKLNIAEIKKQIAGENQLKAQAKLTSIAGVASAKITYRPSWLKFIPRNQKNIVINKEVK